MGLFYVNAKELVVINITFSQAILAFIGAMGIPSAVMGFIVWRLEKRISKQEEKIEEREKAREDLMLLQVQNTRAAVALAEATARAVKRIPDAKCNGDMDAALEYAAEIKHKQKDFLAEQGIRALWE